MSGIETSTEFRRLGTCLVTWGGRNMGYTKGGVTAKITTTWVDITVDRWGEVPLDAIDIGTIIEAFTPLAQGSVDNYNDGFDTGVTGGVGVGPITFGRQVGTSIIKQLLILNPINDNDRIIIYKAGCVDVDELGFNNEGHRLLGLHWKGFIDENLPEGQKTFQIFGHTS